MNDLGNLTTGAQADPLHRFTSSVSSFWHTYVQPPEPEPNWSRGYYPTASVIRPSAQASAFDLHRYANTRYALVKTDGDVTASPEAVQCMKHLLNTYIVDNGPTPQVGATPEGTIEVQWLAGGTMLSVILENDGEYNVYAVRPDRSVIFDEDVEAGHEPSPELVEEVKGVLAGMAQRVKTRPRTFWG